MKRHLFGVRRKELRCWRGGFEGLSRFWACLPARQGFEACKKLISVGLFQIFPRPPQVPKFQIIPKWIQATPLASFQIPDSQIPDYSEMNPSLAPRLVPDSRFPDSRLFRNEFKSLSTPRSRYQISRFQIIPKLIQVTFRASFLIPDYSEMNSSHSPRLVPDSRFPDSRLFRNWSKSHSAPRSRFQIPRFQIISPCLIPHPSSLSTIPDSQIIQTFSYQTTS